MSNDSKPSLTQQMLAEARRVQQGQAGLEVLKPYVDQLLGGLQQAQLQFVQDASGNPEVPQDTIPQVMAAFGRFGAGLEQMQAGLASGDSQSVLAGAQVVEEASAAIRQARDAYQNALAVGGQTPFPFLNRLLLHIGHLENGTGDPRYAVAALAETPEFLNKIAQDIAVQEERVSHDEAKASAESAAAEVRTVCENMYVALTQQWAQATEAQKQDFLSVVSQRLRTAAEQLSAALSAYVETDLGQGPTPILVVNLVIRSFENWGQGLIGMDDFRKVLNQAQTAMHQMLAELPAEHARAAADHLELVLTRRDEALLAEGTDAVSALMPTLRQAAHEVALQASAGVNLDEEEEVLDFVDAADAQQQRRQMSAAGLPANLQHVMDVAEAYIRGEVGERDLTTAVDTLDRSVQSTGSRAANTPGAATLLTPLQKGLDLLQEATQSLRTLPQNPDQRVLEAARSLMEQASQALLEVGEMTVEGA